MFYLKSFASYMYITAHISLQNCKKKLQEFPFSLQDPQANSVKTFSLETELQHQLNFVTSCKIVEDT